MLSFLLIHSFIHSLRFFLCLCTTEDDFIGSASDDEAEFAGSIPGHQNSYGGATTN
jgi:hypothetical protein